MDFKEWRLILYAFCTRERPQVGRRDLSYFLANGLKMKDPMEKNIRVLSEENYYCGLYDGACTGAVSRTKILFRERCDLFKELKVCCYAHIGESGALLIFCTEHTSFENQICGGDT
uniref:Uncharacterized protein n=1 Tax=Pseudo-nitzschia australis TaxID=44445 RepID=A0A7S4EH09_9STRA